MFNIEEVAAAWNHAGATSLLLHPELWGWSSWFWSLLARRESPFGIGRVRFVLCSLSGPTMGMRGGPCCRRPMASGLRCLLSCFPFNLILA